MKLALTFEELADAVRNAPPPTADDVSITWDGRRLDSKEKVLAFLAELDPHDVVGVLDLSRRMTASDFRQSHDVRPAAGNS